MSSKDFDEEYVDFSDEQIPPDAEKEPILCATCKPLWATSLRTRSKRRKSQSRKKHGKSRSRSKRRRRY